MSIRVIIPPGPVVTPSDIPGGHASDDADVTRAIAAATRAIDGPSGWLGRSLGPQTLELSGWFGCRRIRLPYPPLIKVVSIVTEDGDGNAETADPSTYRWRDNELIVAVGAAWVTRPLHRIRYEAGYNGIAVAAGGTGALPAEAVDAIVLLAQDRIRIGALDAGLRAESVEGISSATYLDADRFSELSRSAAKSLLDGLRIYS